MPQHALGHVEIRDDTALHGADGHDAAGRAPDHAFRVFADGQDLIVFLVDGDHRRLLDDDAFPFHVNQGVGGAEIDPHIAPESAKHNLRVSPFTGRGRTPLMTLTIRRQARAVSS